jgi:hypothetical protein
MSTQYLEEAAVVAGFQLGYECMDNSWMMVCASNIACLRMHAFASVREIQFLLPSIHQNFFFKYSLGIYVIEE